MSIPEPYILAIDGRVFRAYLADTLKAGERPGVLKVAMYYGKDYPKRVEHPTASDRLVFRKNDGSYVVVPDIPASKKFYLYVPKYAKIKHKPEMLGGKIQERDMG